MMLLLNSIATALFWVEVLLAIAIIHLIIAAVCFFVIEFYPDKKKKE